MNSAAIATLAVISKLCEAGKQLMQVPTISMDQAASVAALRRRYVIAPMPTKPKIIIAQVEGSGRRKSHRRLDLFARA
jgi:hypothetical protein